MLISYNKVANNVIHLWDDNLTANFNLDYINLMI